MHGTSCAPVHLLVLQPSKLKHQNSEIASFRTYFVEGWQIPIDKYNWEIASLRAYLCGSQILIDMTCVKTIIVENCFEGPKVWICLLKGYWTMVSHGLTMETKPVNMLGGSVLIFFFSRKQSNKHELRRRKAIHRTNNTQLRKQKKITRLYRWSEYHQNNTNTSTIAP